MVDNTIAPGVDEPHIFPLRTSGELWKPIVPLEEPL